MTIATLLTYIICVNQYVPVPAYNVCNLHSGNIDIATLCTHIYDTMHMVYICINVYPVAGRGGLPSGWWALAKSMGALVVKQ